MNADALFHVNSDGGDEIEAQGSVLLLLLLLLLLPFYSSAGVCAIGCCRREVSKALSSDISPGAEHVLSMLLQNILHGEFVPSCSSQVLSFHCSL